MSKASPQLSARLLINPINFLSLGFGSGLFPKAPGTFGTLAAIPVYLLLSQFEFSVYLLITFLMFIVGIFICGYTSKKLGVADHPAIVWDEIVGYLITMTMIPVEWVWILSGFLLFRLFDIVKPWPISVLDRRVKGGTGIMLDDVLAGIFAGLVLHFGYNFII